jgi:hypothetical protein
LATQAHSGTNAWGSNLDGSGATYIESYLVSPAIDLKGGNLATLKFWQNYDFSEEATYQAAQLLLFTNSQTLPITLATYDDATAGWEEAEFDLTPYIGKVIHLAWDHELLDFSFDNELIHSGWLVDDVQVTITNAVYGTVRVTNNIGNASFTIEGPTPIAGTGRSMARSLALAGEYTITFDSVPYYETPVSETKVLAGGETVVFEGNYTFADANANGMPDSWEQEQFGEVSPTRNRATDTDGDGMSDEAEFIAGSNPTDVSSTFQVTTAEVMTGNRVHIEWPSQEGKNYQVFGSSDGRSWSPFGPPIRATGDATAYTSPTSSSQIYFFKIEVVP